MTRHLATVLGAVLLLVPPAAQAARLDDLGFDPAAETNRAASVYLAQENMFLFRMRYPNGVYREFDLDYARPRELRGGDGWHGYVTRNGTLVRSGKKVKGGPAEYLFKDGRLIAFSQGSVHYTIPYDAPRPPTDGGAPYYFDAAHATRGADAADAADGAPRNRRKLDRQVARVLGGKWTGSGRLAWPFANPNENGFLYASLALLSTLLFSLRRRAFAIAGGVAFLACVTALAATASRGSILAFAIGLVPVAALRFRALWRDRRVWILCALALALAGGWFLTHNGRLLTRGFSGGSRWSNQVRLSMWKAAPQMIAEAPGGWRFAHVGRAYMDWYSPLDEVALPGSLMNEHLTALVARGRAGRAGYVFAWALGLALLGAAAWRTRNGVAFGMWLMYAVAGWFNPVLSPKALWVVPLLAVGFALWERPWRQMKVRDCAWAAGAAALATVAALAAIAALGGGKPARGYPVRAEKNRVYVKSLNPAHWLVDDGCAVGGVMACKDIRGYYAGHPNAPGIGYTRDVQALPDGKVKRLVLAGKAGADWLEAFGARVEAEGEAAVKALPEELVFISPTFSPSEIPQPYFDFAKVRVVVGEFAARYDEEYKTPPQWVTVVKGMELYSKDWMQYVVGW